MWNSSPKRLKRLLWTKVYTHLNALCDFQRYINTHVSIVLALGRSEPIRWALIIAMIPSISEQDGLRYVAPYERILEIRIKKRWEGKTIEQLFTEEFAFLHYGIREWVLRHTSIVELRLLEGKWWQSRLEILEIVYSRWKELEEFSQISLETSH